MRVSGGEPCFVVLFEGFVIFYTAVPVCYYAGNVPDLCLKSMSSDIK